MACAKKPMTTASHLGEFERIARFFAPLAAPGGLGLVDDVALIDGPAGSQYALTTDAIVEGTDYFPDDPPRQISQKLLRVNLSDLAAKGAEPLGYLLVTVLAPTCGEDWLKGFTSGLAADQATYRIVLLGGDSSATPGPTTLSVTAIGRIAKGKAVLRSGARAGDVIYVSGTLGDSAVGLCVLKNQLKGLSAADRDFLVDRYRLPQPRVSLGARLVGIARAMIDISDGLVADARHLCDASKLGAMIEAARLPLSSAMRRALAIEPQLNRLVMGGGDDYELLFAVPPEACGAVAEAAREAGVAVTEIGRMALSDGVKIVDASGKNIRIDMAGYTHF